MQNEMTIEAAIIELNRLKSQERMDIDRERLNAAIDKLTEAGRFRIKRKPMPEPEFCLGIGCCPNCGLYLASKFKKFCSSCGQVLDWGD